MLYILLRKYKASNESHYKIWKSVFQLPVKMKYTTPAAVKIQPCHLRSDGQHFTPPSIIPPPKQAEPLILDQPFPCQITFQMAVTV